MSKYKIAFLSYRSDPLSGGQGIYVYELSKALKKLGHDIHIFSGPPYPKVPSEVKFEKIENLNLFETFNLNDRLKKFLQKSNRDYLDYYEFFVTLIGGFPEMRTFGARTAKLLIQRGGYDIILDNQSLSYGILALQKHFPLIEILHHPITQDYKYDLIFSKGIIHRFFRHRWYSFLKMNKFVAPRLKQIITPSAVSKKDIQKDFKVLANKISVIHNGIDLQVFKPDKNIERKKFKLITVASADVPLKGLDTTIKAMKRVKNSFPDLQLLVIGEPKEGGHTQRLIKKLGLADSINFKSNLSKEDLAKEYQSSSLAIVSSLYEGFCFPAIEAQACGTPLISSNIPTLSEVTHGEAFYFSPEDSEELANLVCNFYKRPDKFQMKADSALISIEKNFNWDDVALKFEMAIARTIKEFKNAHF